MEKKRITLADLDILKKQFLHNGLNTVCTNARCPNIGECFKNKTATFMILGNQCTRDCKFCSTPHGTPAAVDGEEPHKLAQTVKNLGLKYAVITSVTRDDLADGGAGHFADVVTALKKLIPGIKTEVLVPDFKGDKKSIDIVCSSGIDVFGHNVETVPSLYKYRPGADYKRSLNVLAYAKSKGQIVKTGIMLGLGETEQEILDLIKDIKNTGCDILTIGQYLKPSKESADIVKEYTKKEFEYFKQKAVKYGLKVCVAGRYVRSSYFADNAYKMLAENEN